MKGNKEKEKLVIITLFTINFLFIQKNHQSFKIGGFYYLTSKVINSSILEISKALAIVSISSLFNDFL